MEACFALIATVEDTNLLHRGGLAGLRFSHAAPRSGSSTTGGVGTRPAGASARVPSTRASSPGSSALAGRRISLR